MGYSKILIFLLWGIISLTYVIQYAPFCKDLKNSYKWLALLVFTIGGPVFGMNQILMAILDIILPEGWDDDNGFDPRY